MGVYDGNQLPEAPTSVFQLAVSAYYTLFVTVLFSLGAFAMLAAVKELDKELPNNLYMKGLITKHNAVARGLLAFIPAVYSLAHLYTSSLHNGSLYSASNIIYAAVFGFATRYLGTAFGSLSKDSTHMDTIKAVYECLYMLTRCLGRLAAHECPKPVLHQRPEPIFKGMSTEEVDPAHGLCVNKDFGTQAWLSAWVSFNVFLAIAAQDDRRSWSMFLAWLRRSTSRMDANFVPPADSVVHNFCSPGAWYNQLCGCATSACACCTTPSASYAYWLFSQGSAVRDYTGTFIINQQVPAKLNMASCATWELFSHACRYIQLMSKHFQESLREALNKRRTTIVCYNGTCVRLHLSEQASQSSNLVDCLRYVNLAGRGLDMACERYVCRKTPACAAMCLPASRLVPALKECWNQLFQDLPLEEGDPAIWWNKEDSSAAGYWCGLWLAYMHMVLLAVDILRLHNNKAVFKGSTTEDGFWELLMPGAPVSGTRTRDECEIKPRLLLPDVHDMDDNNLHGVAAIIATLLLAQRMSTERLCRSTSTNKHDQRRYFEMPLLKAKVYLTALRDPEDRGCKLFELDATEIGKESVLQSRAELVECHSSLPGIVEGVKSLSPADWTESLQTPLVAAAFVVAATAIINATISCSNGVFLVTIAGFVQAVTAWGLLQYLENLPVTGDTVQLRHAADTAFNKFFIIGWVYRGCMPWLARRLLGVVWALLGMVMLFVNFLFHIIIFLCMPGLVGRVYMWLETVVTCTSMSIRHIVHAPPLGGEASFRQKTKEFAHEAWKTARGHEDDSLRNCPDPDNPSAIGTSRTAAAAASIAVIAGAADMATQRLLGPNIAHKRSAVAKVVSLCMKPAISLAECFDPTTVNGKLYKTRIDMIDVFLHIFIAASVIIFGVGMGLALYGEPYYATPAGMCLGRCHDRPDCQTNLTLNLPAFEGPWSGLPEHPVCPGYGRVMYPGDSEAPAEAYQQCPAVVPLAATWESSGKLALRAPVWLRIGANNVSSHFVEQADHSHKQSECNATVAITNSATGLPVSSGIMVTGRWFVCPTPTKCEVRHTMDVPTDASGKAAFVSPCLGIGRWHVCKLKVLRIRGYRFNHTAHIEGNASYPEKFKY